MATNTYVELDLAEANDLADLTGIRRDLETAREFAVRLKEMREQPNCDGTLADALTTATLVRYARAFCEGKRNPLNVLDQEIFSVLSSAQRAKHEEFRDYRNKHIAHSVNAFEENIPKARYWVERVQDEGIEQITCTSVVVVGMSVPDIEAIIELTSTLLPRVEERLKAEKKRLLGIVRQLPLDQVLRGPRINRETTTSAKAEEPRRRF